MKPLKVCSSWKNNYEKRQGCSTDVKNSIQEVNWSRKNQQTLVGDRLKQLESNWVGLVSKNYEIEQAILNMEQEYLILKTEHELKTKDSEPVQ